MTSPPPAKPAPTPAAGGGAATPAASPPAPSPPAASPPAPSPPAPSPPGMAWPPAPVIPPDDRPLWTGGTRVRRLLRRHPNATDSVLALVLAVLTTGALVHREYHQGAHWWAFLLNLALVLPLAFRRRAPTVVFGAVVAAAAVQWLTGESLPGDFAILLALYTVAAHESRKRALIAAGVVEFGVILAAIRYSPGHGLIPSIVFLTGIVAAGLFIGTTVRARRAYLAALVERAARLERERDQQAQLAATAERTRIAREMHDIVAHSLSVVISLADGAALSNRSHPDQATAAMEQVSAVGRQALNETRRLLGVLRDDRAPADLAPQPGIDRVDDLLTQVRDAGVPTRLVVTGKPVTLTATQQTAVYRVVQEALTNVLKHADHVTDVRVHLGWSVAGLDVEVTDDGVGPGERGPGGQGLVGMAERVAAHGGRLTAGARSPRGWRVHAFFPGDTSGVTPTGPPA